MHGIHRVSYNIIFILYFIIFICIQNSQQVIVFTWNSKFYMSYTNPTNPTSKGQEDILAFR